MRMGHRRDNFFRKQITMQDTFNQLIGSKIDAAFINDDKFSIILVSEDKKFLITHDQQCCESISFENISGTDNLLNATINNIHIKEWNYNGVRSGVDDYIGSFGITITTDKGYVDFEVRETGSGNYNSDLMVELLDHKYDIVANKFSPLFDF